MHLSGKESIQCSEKGVKTSKVIGRTFCHIQADVSPVSYNDCGTIGTHFSQRGLDVAFCLSVEGRGGLWGDFGEFQLVQHRLYHSEWDESETEASPHPAG